MTTPLTKGIPVTLGNIHGIVFGGPFRKYVPGTRRLVGVKMAAEICHPCEIVVDTEDFSVPLVQDMQNGIIKSINAMSAGYDVYVGCMGGIGRTGLFMGCMAKVMIDCGRKGIVTEEKIGDPVLWVREHYLSHAIETKEQQSYVVNFDTSVVIAHVESLLKGPEPEVRVEMPTLWQYAMWWLSGGPWK